LFQFRVSQFGALYLATQADLALNQSCSSVGALQIMFLDWELDLLGDKSNHGSKFESAVVCFRLRNIPSLGIPAPMPVGMPCSHVSIKQLDLTQK
jgi:hypothetical protein